MVYYYKVVAKCGHVGRNNYYRGKFGVIAESGKDAASKVRFYPRVKHHHQDAILSVNRISREEYNFLKKEWKENPYFHCNNRTMQDSFYSEIEKDIFPETPRQVLYRKQFRADDSEKYKRKKKETCEWKRKKQAYEFDLQLEGIGA